MLIRTHNASPINRLAAEIDDIFSSLLHAPFTTPVVAGMAAGLPAVNVWEDAESYSVEAELPGLKAEEVNIEVRGRELTISGERRLPTHEGGRWHRRERGVGRFAKTLTLPGDFDAQQVQASLERGVLSIRLAKLEAARTRQITVNAG